MLANKITIILSFYLILIMGWIRLLSLGLNLLSTLGYCEYKGWGGPWLFHPALYEKVDSMN